MSLPQWSTTHVRSYYYSLTLNTMTNSIQGITDKAQKLITLRDEIKSLDLYLKELKAQKDIIQLDMIETMKVNSLSSWKVESTTVSRVIKHDISVTNEWEVTEELRSRNLYKDYVFEKLDSIRFKTLARSLYDKWQLLEWSQLVEKEYISIRNSSKKQLPIN